MPQLDEINTDSQELQDTETPTESSNKGLVGVVTVVIILLAVIAGAGYYYLNAKQPETTVSPTPKPTTTPVVTQTQPTLHTSNTPTSNRPTLTPAPTMEVVNETYTHQSLPGFSIQYPQSWEVTVKEFTETDNKGFMSDYTPTCEEDCMGVRFSQDNVSLDLVFNVEGLSDQSGFRCSNTVEHTLVEEPWHRIKSSTQHYYSKDVKLEVDIGSDGNFVPGFFGSTSDEWNIVPNTHYEFCDYNAQNFLVEDEIQYKSGLAYRIYLQSPEIKDNPSEEVLEELDQMVLSITGIKE